jgi:hypothetical protein
MRETGKRLPGRLKGRERLERRQAKGGGRKPLSLPAQTAREGPRGWERKADDRTTGFEPIPELRLALPVVLVETSRPVRKIARPWSRSRRSGNKWASVVLALGAGREG